MTEDFSDAKLRCPIWLFGHSPPKAWADVITGALDPRHPTRHNIWTSVADYLQDWVFQHGPRMRLDADKLLFRNAFCSAADVKPKLDLTKDVIVARRDHLAQQIAAFRPQVIITFSADAFALLRAGTGANSPVARTGLKVRELGDAFREARDSFDPARVNVLPLLHASVARAAWESVGWKFAGSTPDKEREEVYFRYVGHELGKLLLSHAREWPIWREPELSGLA